MIQGLGDLNLSLAMAAIGSALGTGVAGMAAVGAWKKAFASNKAAPFILVAFVGAPLSQTIYGMILQGAIQTKALELGVTDGKSVIALAVLGALCGFAIGLSAFMQGKAGAKAADALTETGKGFGNYIMVVGVIETVALFVMVFALGAVGKIVM